MVNIKNTALFTFMLFSHLLVADTSITFRLIPGTLENNVSALLNKHSENKLLLWQVSKKHQVIVDSVVTGSDVYHVLDQIISPYQSPFQIKASVFTRNGVVQIHYDNRQ